MLYSPINDDDWSIAIIIAALVHIHNEIIDAVRIGHFRPAGTVKHFDCQLVVILYRLDNKVATDIVALIRLV